MKLWRPLFAFCLILLAGMGWFFKNKHAKEVPYPVTQQRPFVIVIPSYNNEKYIKKNLSSVFFQNYENYRVIYIDDFSTDCTLEKAREFLKAHDPNHKALLISNPANYGSLNNIYNAVHTCEDHEIIVILDGDDFFAHENVLKTLNKTYANPDIWLTYGNYLDYPSYKQDPKICKPLPSYVVKTASFREHEWVTSHPRTFYASLFKEIKIEDLYYKGHFFPMGGDLAIFFPMLEMARAHAHFIDEILYLYNRENPLSDHKVNFSFLKECASAIRSKKRYSALRELPSHPQTLNAKSDIMIFSSNRPLELYALLESIQRHAQGVNKISVLYEATHAAYAKGYQSIKKKFRDVCFLPYTNNFKESLIQRLFTKTVASSPYVFFLADGMIIKDQLNLSLAIDLLEKTKSHSFFLSYHQNLKLGEFTGHYLGLPPHHPVRGCASPERVFTWQFSEGKEEWATPNSLEMALYRKEDLKKDFLKLPYTDRQTLQSQWNLCADQKKIGLFYETSKGAYLKGVKQYASHTLLEKFEGGLKIDIDPFFQLTNSSRHLSNEISFTNRD